MELKLIEARVERYRTQGSFARAIGIERPLYSKIESGKVLPNRETLRRMCLLLNREPLGLYDPEAIDLAGALKNRPESRRSDRHRNTRRMSFRISDECAQRLKEDFLEVLGYQTWQELFSGFLEGCIKEYERRTGEGQKQRKGGGRYERDREG